MSPTIPGGKKALANENGFSLQLKLKPFCEFSQNILDEHSLWNRRKVRTEIRLGGDYRVADFLSST